MTTVDQQQRPGPPAPRRRSRRDEILEIAVGLFAARGYHGVSMDDLGSAAGVTGPALYHHFAGKEAMLVAALIPVSESLLHGGKARVARHPEDASAALADLIEFHVELGSQFASIRYADISCPEKTPALRQVGPGHKVRCNLDLPLEAAAQ